MRNRSHFILGLFILATTALFSQQQPTGTYTFSLAEAIEFGIENNYQSRIAEKDVEIALKQKWEIIAQGLPQINGAV
ncbi:MAG: TolC family protein, partial [Gramella sp.]|nr:TolC family protein [Christiangramia sp.]